MGHETDILGEATRLALSCTETTLNADNGNGIDMIDIDDEAVLLARLNAGNGDEEPSVGDEVGHEARARLSVYQEITDLLVARGVPRNEIAWIHDAKTPGEREALFARTRSGEIRIIIGSTFRMGVGVNIQERCYAVHHITTPWRPCDVKQADGRIWRPGNLFPEVWICRYIAAPSFDGFSWQGIETKGKFEDAYLRGDPTVRTMSDIDEQIISAGEIKALASGDPRIVQKVRLEHELTRLKQQRDGWDGTRRNARMGVVRADGEAETIRQRADWQRQYLRQRTEDRTVVLLDTTYDTTDPAQHRAVGKAVRDQLMDWASSTDVTNQLRVRSSASARVGSYRGLPLWAMIELDYGGKKKLPYLMLADERVETRQGYLAHTTTTLTRLSAFTVYIGDTKEVLPRMESAANDLDDRIAGLAAEEVATQDAAAKLRAQLEEPWEHACTHVSHDGTGPALPRRRAQRKPEGDRGDDRRGAGPRRERGTRHRRDYPRGGSPAGKGRRPLDDPGHVAPAAAACGGARCARPGRDACRTVRPRRPRVGPQRRRRGSPPRHGAHRRRAGELHQHLALRQPPAHRAPDPGGRHP